MSQLNQTFLEKAQKLGEKSKFSELHDMCNESAIDSSDFIPILKRLKKARVLKKASFWHSDLPSLFLSNTLNSSFALEFLEDYFRSDRNCVHELNLAIYKEGSGLFMRAFKLFLAFKKPRFYASLEKMLGKHFELGAYLGELEYIKNIYERLEKEEAKAYELIDDIPVDQFLLGLHQFDKVVIRSRYGFDLKTRADWEVSLLELLDEYIKGFCNGTRVINRKFSSTDEYLIEIEQLNKQYGDGKLDKTYASINDYINKSIKILQKRNIIERFLAGHLEFADFIQETGTLVSTDEYQRFDMNDHKKNYAETFFSNKNEGLDYVAEHGTKAKIELTKNILQYYGLGSYLDKDELQVNLTHVSQFLTYQTYWGNCEFQYFPVNSVIDSIHKDTGINKEEIQAFVDKVTFNLEEPPQNFTKLLHYPLIRIADHYVWLGALLYERDWSIALYNKVKTGQFDGIKKQIADDNLEEAVAKIFRDAGFDSQKVNYNKGSFIGDIDVFAIRGKDIFIVEVKSGIFDNSFSRANYIEGVRLEYGAANQLKKGLDYIKTHWPDFQEKVKLDENLRFEDYNFVPLIISNYFDGDLINYPEGIHKISMVELDVILNNSKESLYTITLKIGDEKLKMSTNDMQRLLSGTNPNYKLRQADNINYNIWGAKQICDAETFIKCIIENRVWSDISSEWRFDPVMIKLE